MKELELRHLAPYVPHGLKMQRNDEEVINLTERFYSIPAAILTNYKPILRPLSDMYKIPEIMDSFSEYALDGFENAFFCLGRCNNCYDFITYEQAELMFKYHIDLFGLIDKGMAVNMNEL